MMAGRDPRCEDTARAETFYQLLDTDLRLLAAEARKLDGFANQISGLFGSSDIPGIKDSCDRALAKLRSLDNGGARSMHVIRQAPVSPGPDACMGLAAVLQPGVFLPYDGLTA